MILAMTLSELGEVSKIFGVVLTALTTLIGLVWWMSALYWNVKSINLSLKNMSNITQNHESRLDNHESRLDKHGFRLDVIEEKVQIPRR